MKDLVVRCSELKQLMTKSRSKSEPLSATTKTWLKEKVKEQFLGYRKVLDTPAINKGNEMEEEAISLLSQLHEDFYVKHVGRKTNNWLSGECDILDDAIHDIKCSWSWETFPIFQEDAQEAVKKAGYDWQMRGYMMLYDRKEAFVHYCMMTTPRDLLKPWEIENDNEEINLYNDTIHQADWADIQQRISSVKVERDAEIEKEMKAQYDLANEYWKQLWEEITNK
jgi:hypothetical protein